MKNDSSPLKGDTSSPMKPEPPKPRMSLLQ